MSTQPSGRPRVAYLLKRFPRLSETFILHEILELERQGLELRLFAVLDPKEAIVQGDVARVRARPRYLPTSWRDAVSFVGAHLNLLARHPRRYVSTLVEALAESPRAPRLKHFARAGWLGRELQRAGVTHLHAHFANGPAAMAYFVHRLTGLPFSFTAHAKDIYTSPPGMLVTKMLAARFVATCTDHNAAHLAGLLPEGNTASIHRIYHGVDLRRFTPASQSNDAGSRSPGIPLILSVGRLVEKKGLSYLIDACRILNRRGYDFRLQIVGSGELKEPLRDQIAAAGLKSIVTLLGARPQEDLVQLYRMATVFALPCVVLENGDRDGIPNVLVEAMSVGLPVISTTVSGIPELIRDGETGLLVPPKDAPALADALAKLLDSPTLRDRFATSAARWVAAEFDERANAATLLALFDPESTPPVPLQTAALAQPVH